MRLGRGHIGGHKHREHTYTAWMSGGAWEDRIGCMEGGGGMEQKQVNS